MLRCFRFVSAVRHVSSRKRLGRFAGPAVMEFLEDRTLLAAPTSLVEWPGNHVDVDVDAPSASDSLMAQSSAHFDEQRPVLATAETSVVQLSESNDPPEVSDQSFTIIEDSNIGDPVGTVIASDPNAGQILTFAITDGDPHGIFAIDPESGEISVARSGAFNAETMPEILLMVEVTDNGSPPESESATVTIRVVESPSLDLIYVNDDFTQPERTVIADADLNTPGDQLAVIGVNAFNTIQEGINAVDRSGAVHITDDLSTDGAAVYTENVVTDDYVTIIATDGELGAVTVDGGAVGRVFTIKGGNHYVTLTSLVIQNGSAASGAGIYNTAHLAINDSLIQNNTATDTGGGIENRGMLAINGSQLIDNSAGVNGGGLYNFSHFRADVSETLIDGNTAGEEGGGVWNGIGGLLIVQDDSMISNNTASGAAADQGGGGIFNNDGRVVVNGSTILGNAADGLAGSGGGLFTVDGGVTFEDSSVSGNTANRAGGGIEMLHGVVELINSNLDDNVAGPAGAANPGSGGGLHFSGDGGGTSTSRVTISGGTVSGNSAARSGGGLWNRTGNIMVVRSGTVIDGNRALGDGADHGGGGIYNESGRLAIHSAVTISGNTAEGVEGSGGGVFVKSGTVTIDDSHVIENSANRAGGGIEVVTGIVQLRNTHLDHNIAGPSGAANPGSGGGMHVTGQVGQVAHVTIFGGTVSGNTAAQEGGGLWNHGPTVMVVRDGVVIDGNKASGYASHHGGGGIYTNSGRLAILGSTISNNIADGLSGSGGGIYVARGGVTIEGGTTITGNSANRAGGGIEVITGEVILVDSVLDSNDAGITGTANPGRGGALHVSSTDHSRVDLRNTLVTGNSAALEGGGLWHQTDNVMLVREGSQVTGNTASGAGDDEGGGGIFNNGGRLILNAATVSDNTADGALGSGGGLLHFNGVTTIEDSTLTSNTAHRAGGGIEIVNGSLLTVNMTLTENTAGPPGTANAGRGGGLHITGTTQVRATIRGGTISGNRAALEGGGLWHQAGSILVVTGGTTISQNTASGDAADEGGGGLFNNGGRVAITDASLWGNAADGEEGSGGGIISLGGAVTLDNSTLSGNIANGDGGGIVSHGEFISANATIANNRSNANDVGGGTGGGLFNGGLVTLKNTIVAGNLIGSGADLNDLAGGNVRTNSIHNLISDASSAGGLVDGISGNIVGDGGTGSLLLASILAPLADNGGLSLTHALVVDSPAIDAGSNAAATDIYGLPIVHDQRGTGFARVINGTVDIGATEA